MARHLNYLFLGGAVRRRLSMAVDVLRQLRQSRRSAAVAILPLVNPLDLIQCGALIVLSAWSRRIRSATFAPKAFQTAELAYGTTRRRRLLSGSMARCCARSIIGRGAV